MEPSSRPPRTPSRLSDLVRNRLNTYALAASAAGAGVMTLARPAQAEVIYTPSHVVISPYGVHLYDLSFNYDVKTDFVIQTKFYSTTNQSAGTQRLIALGADSNGVESRAAALKAGEQIGPNRNFSHLGVMASDWGSAGASTSIKRGPWVNVNNRYLGLKFKINGETHFGWARLSVEAERGRFYVQATLTGYAYETIPDKPIIAGEENDADDSAEQPVTLGTLALGRK